VRAARYRGTLAPTNHAPLITRLIKAPLRKRHE